MRENSLKNELREDQIREDHNGERGTEDTGEAELSFPMRDVDRPSKGRDLLRNPNTGVLRAGVNRKPFRAGPVVGVFPFGAVNASLVHVRVVLDGDRRAVRK